MDNCGVADLGAVNAGAGASSAVLWDTEVWHSDTVGKKVSSATLPSLTWKDNEHPKHAPITPQLVGQTKFVFDNIGGAHVRLARDGSSTVVKIDARLPELSEVVSWTIELSKRELGNDIIPVSAYRLIEGLIYNYRVALNGRL